MAQADLFQITEQALEALGLGLELVDIERLPGGLLRVTIDHPEGVRIEHCEAGSRQLGRVYEVENIDYKRLEVGSPGVDRPLRHERDYLRFLGERVEVKFRVPFQGRKTWVGTLIEVEPVAEGTPASFGLVFDVKPGDEQVLSFTLDEVDRARLEPVLDFKGRKK